jgi:tetratricopeptide (TPR) repeat protein
LQQLRREQIEVALAFFDGIASQVGDDPQARHDVAWASVEAGKLQIFLGRTKEGLSSLQRAIALTENLVRENPRNVKQGWLRADAIIAHGAYSTGKEALKRIERGVAELEKLRESHPQSAEVRIALATGCITLGAALENHRNHAESERVMRRAVELCDEMIEAAPNDRALISMRARARVNLCAALRQSKQFETARAQHALAEADLEHLFGVDPADRETIDGLAVLRINGAYDLEASGKGTTP